MTVKQRVTKWAKTLSLAELNQVEIELMAEWMRERNPLRRSAIMTRQAIIQAELTARQAQAVQS